MHLIKYPRCQKKKPWLFSICYRTKNTYVNVCNRFGNNSFSDRFCVFVSILFWYCFWLFQIQKRDMQLFLLCGSNWIEFFGVGRMWFGQFWHFCFFFICGMAFYIWVFFLFFCFKSKTWQPFTGVSTQQKKIYMRKKRKTKSFTVNSKCIINCWKPIGYLYYDLDENFFFFVSSMKYLNTICFNYWKIIRKSEIKIK